MASKKNYSAEFKAKVAQEALDQSKKNLHSLAEKYDLPVSAVITWTTQYENKGSEAFQAEASQNTSDSDQEPIADHEEVDVEVSDKNISESVEYGVMKDRLDYRRLTFWSVLGTVLFLIFVKALIEMFEYNAQVSSARISENSEYYEVTQQRRAAEETLNSFGVVDLENGIYRIPLDSAINDIAGESE